jgi:hypothetical protein
MDKEFVVFNAATVFSRSRTNNKTAAKERVGDSINSLAAGQAFLVMKETLSYATLQKMVRDVNADSATLFYKITPKRDIHGNAVGSYIGCFERG